MASSQGEKTEDVPDESTEVQTLRFDIIRDKGGVNPEDYIVVADITFGENDRTNALALARKLTTRETEFEELRVKVDELSKQVVALEGRLAGLPAMEKLSEDVAAEIQAIESKRRHHWSGSLPQRLRYTINDMRQTELDAVAGCRVFRDDCVNWLRAVSLVVESVGNAATHSEKTSRCRGAVEIVESAIRKLRERSFDSPFNWRFWNDDCFRSDYPTREFVRRIHDLEAELAHAKADGASKNPVEPPF